MFLTMFLFANEQWWYCLIVIEKNYFTVKI